MATISSDHLHRELQPIMTLFFKYPFGRLGHQLFFQFLSSNELDPDKIAI